MQKGLFKIPVDEVKLGEEQLVMFRDVDKLGLFARSVGYMNIYRYAKDGAINLSGIRVYLGFVKTPAGSATSREAVIRFIQELSE
jgi:hypothetical protein